MARTKKYTPEETLRSLFNLQFIDSRIDNMREVRGELPMEVKDSAMQVEGIEEVDLDLVFEPPWNKDMMSEAAKLELNL